MKGVKKRSQKQKVTEEKDSSTSRVSPRKASKRQAKETSTEEKDSSTSSVSPRKAPKRQATKKSTEGKDSSTSRVSPRKAPKRQATEMSTADNGESSKSPRKAAAERQASTKAARETNGQASTKAARETNGQASTKAARETNGQASTKAARETNGQASTKAARETNGQASTKAARETNGQASTKAARETNGQASTKAARETNGQAETSMEKLNSRQAPGTSKTKQGGGDGPDAADKASASSTMPAIYPVKEKTYNKRFNKLSDTVIIDCKPFQVESGFNCYIEENVQGDDWQAVWSSHQLGCDVLVKVQEVCFPHAKIELVEPFCCQLNSLGHPGGDGQQLKTKEEVTDLLSGKNNKAFLLELFPVNDSSGDLKKTAEVLELYRFFYSYIWRASDEDDCGDYYFSMYKLEPRMKLYYDVQKKKVSEAVQQTYTSTMSEYQKKYWHFKIRRTEVFGGGDDDDDEEEEKASDEELNNLWRDVCRLENVLEKLDDPVMRKHCQVRANNAVVTHLVAHEFTPELIKTADIGKDATIEQHKTLASALESCFNGDTIIIFPGTYSGEGVTKITKDITIKGAGKSPSDVIITYDEKSSKSSLKFACVDCMGFMIAIKNITFEGKLTSSQSNCLFAALLVSRGKTFITNCAFRSFTGGVWVADEGKLKLDKCEIYDITKSGVAVRSCGALYLTDSHIHHCGGKSRTDEGKKATSTSEKSAVNSAGICIGASEWGMPPNRTDVTLLKNKVVDIGGPAVWVEVTKSGTKGRSKPKNLKTLDKVRDELMFVGLSLFDDGQQTFKGNESNPFCIQYLEPPPQNGYVQLSKYSLHI